MSRKSRRRLPPRRRHGRPLWRGRDCAGLSFPCGIRGYRAQLAFSPCQGAGLMGITTRRPSSAKAVDTLSLSTVASLVSPTLNQVNWIRGNPHPPSPPVPYLEVRDRETPVLSGLVLYVLPGNMRLMSHSLAPAARASDLRSQALTSNSGRCAPGPIRREGRGW